MWYTIPLRSCHVDLSKMNVYSLKVENNNNVILKEHLY